MKLIDKDALVAEIERLAKIGRNNASAFDESRNERAIWLQQADVCNRILSFIDTLEGIWGKKKLESEIENVRKNHFINSDFDKATLDGRNITNIAKHFFELGLKVQKGEEV